MQWWLQLGMPNTIAAMALCHWSGPLGAGIPACSGGMQLGMPNTIAAMALCTGRGRLGQGCLRAVMGCSYACPTQSRPWPCALVGAARGRDACVQWWVAVRHAQHNRGHGLVHWSGPPGAGMPACRGGMHGFGLWLGTPLWRPSVEAEGCALTGVLKWPMLLLAQGGQRAPPPPQ